MRIRTMLVSYCLVGVAGTLAMVTVGGLYLYSARQQGQAQITQFANQASLQQMVGDYAGLRIQLADVAQRADRSLDAATPAEWAAGVRQKMTALQKSFERTLLDAESDATRRLIQELRPDLEALFAQSEEFAAKVAGSSGGGADIQQAYWGVQQTSAGLSKSLQSVSRALHQEMSISLQSNNQHVELGVKVLASLCLALIAIYVWSARTFWQAITFQTQQKRPRREGADSAANDQSVAEKADNPEMVAAVDRQTALIRETLSQTVRTVHEIANRVHASSSRLDQISEHAEGVALALQNVNAQDKQLQLLALNTALEASRLKATGGDAATWLWDSDTAITALQHELKGLVMSMDALAADRSDAARQMHRSNHQRMAVVVDHTDDIAREVAAAVAAVADVREPVVSAG